jgi:DNA-binding NarL/FixJ family response regulator
MPVLAIVDDLMFRSKIEAAARQLSVEVDVSASVPAQDKPWSVAIVDLNLNTDCIEAIRQLRARLPQTPIVAYGSHVETELFEKARAAGCTHVIARSAFVQRLPWILNGLSAGG